MKITTKLASLVVLAAFAAGCAASEPESEGFATSSVSKASSPLAGAWVAPRFRLLLGEDAVSGRYYVLEVCTTDACTWPRAREIGTWTGSRRELVLTPSAERLPFPLTRDFEFGLREEGRTLLLEATETADESFELTRATSGAGESCGPELCRF